MMFFHTVVTVQAFGKHLGKASRTYPVVEQDALVEIQAAAAQVDWSKVVDKDLVKKEVKSFKPANLHPLPTATNDRTFLVDMTYTLDKDIPDGKGGVLYPKGFTYNPLDYVRLSSVLVILDAEDPRQVDWFRSSSYVQNYRTRLILSGGEYFPLMEKLERPVFYLMEPMASRLKLKAVPSVVQQKGPYLEVTEISLATENN